MRGAEAIARLGLNWEFGETLSIIIGDKGVKGSQAAALSTSPEMLGRIRVLACLS